MSNCYCGSGADFSACCQPIITGKRPAETAEQLMRARYAAYVTTAMEFVFESTHPDHRQGYDHEGTKAWAENSEWLGLEILGTSKGGPDDTTGEVEFIARFKEKGDTPREHRENGQFKKEKGCWYFTEGVMLKPRPLVSSKVGRNDPCTCGSGLKYKKCCGK
ncbi:MAG: YchJ family protein [Trichlorobacter sp.]|jgi:SEC-C motif-containing protein